MSGYGYPQKPNRRLVGDLARLPAKAIPKWGTVTLSWPGKHADASLVRASPTRLVISMAGAAIEVELKEWPMPSPRQRQRGVRTRMVCPRCAASRDALHYLPGEGWGCRGAGCLDLAYASRHRQRYCPAIRRRAKLLRKLVRARPGSLKAQALREKIAQQESAMLASAR